MEITDFAEMKLFGGAGYRVAWTGWIKKWGANNIGGCWYATDNQASQYFASIASYVPIVVTVEPDSTFPDKLFSGEFTTRSLADPAQMILSAQRALDDLLTVINPKADMDGASRDSLAAIPAGFEYRIDFTADGDFAQGDNPRRILHCPWQNAVSRPIIGSDFQCLANIVAPCASVEIPITATYAEAEEACREPLAKFRLAVQELFGVPVGGIVSPIIGV